MANSVRLESGWLFRQLEAAEQRANNLPFWLSQPRTPIRPSPSAADDTTPKNEAGDERSE